MAQRSLVVNFIGDTAQLEAAFKRVGTGMNGLEATGKRLSSVGSTWTRNVTLPLVGLGVAAAAAAAKFESSMERLHTQAGVSQKGVEQLSKGVLGLAGKVGEAPQQLADAMYHVASSLNATLAPAQRTSTELRVLKIAAEGARVGHANLVDVTNALDAAVVSGISGVQNYTQAMGALNSVVGAGDMSTQDLADALGTGLLAPMKRYGLSLQEVGGALAVFGDNNIRGAEAGTKLASAIRIMAAPSKAASAALADIHLKTLSLANDLRAPNGLVKAFTDLQSHLTASGDTASQQALVITRAFGGRQSQGVQVLLNQLDRLRVKTHDVGTGATDFGKAWAATQQTAAQKTADAVAKMKADLTQFGGDVLPTLLSVGEKIVNDVDKVAKAFQALPKGAQNAIITGGLLVAAIGPTLKLMGVFSTGLGKLWSIAQIAGKVTGLSGAGGDALAASKRVSNVATMNVGELIAKSMVGGGGPGAKGPSAAPVVTGAGAAGAAGGEAEAVAAAARTARLTAGIGGAAVAGVAGFAAASHAQGTALNKLNAFAHGIDPTSVLHLVGLPSLSDLLPTVKKRMNLSPQDIGMLGEGFQDPATFHSVLAGERGSFGKGGREIRTAAAATGGPVSSTTLIQSTRDFLGLNTVLAKLEQRTIGIKQAGRALGDLSKQAYQFGDLKYEFADKLGSELLKSHGVMTKGIRTLIADISQLPPSMRGVTTTAMLAMTTQLKIGAKQADAIFAAIVRDAGAKFREIPTAISGQVQNGRFAGAPSVVGHAMGGLVQIGRPGQKSTVDSVPLNIAGTPIMVAKGEQVAVFTPAQQAFLASRLADVGGLAGVFSHFATGGVVTTKHLPHIPTSKTQIPLTPISASPSAIASQLASLDAAAARTAASVRALTRELAAASAATQQQAALEAQLTTVENARVGLETKLSEAHTTAQRKTIDGELRVNEARKTGLEVQLRDIAVAAAARKTALADQLKAAKAEETAQAKAMAALMAGLAEIPSQLVGAQIKAAQLNNKLTLATNAGDTGGQANVLGAQKRLEQQWLSSDKNRLTKINKALGQRGLTRAQRGALLKDKLAILQEIGTIEGSIGSIDTSLTGLGGGTSGTGSSGSGSSFDVAPAGGSSSLTLPTRYDVRKAIGPVGGAVHHHHHHGDIIVKVEKGGDEHKVYDEIERATGGPLNSRIRRAGLRGT